MAPKASETSRRIPTLPLLAVALVWALALVWWWRQPSTPSTDVSPLHTPTATPLVTDANIVSYTLFLPNDQALLTRHVVKDKNAPAGWSQQSGRALELLRQRLKDLPQGTKFLGLPQRDTKGVVTINFNAAFKKLDTAPETTVALVLDAVAKTLGAVDNPNGKPVKLRVLVDGKPLAIFSQFDLSEPWTSSQPEDETAPNAESVQ